MEISASSVFKLLLAVIGFLLFAHVVGMFFEHALNHGTVYGLVPLFDISAERNVPTFYSSFALLLSAALLALLARGAHRRRQPWHHWAGLAVVFLFLAVDEFTSIHERLTVPVRETLDVGGYLHYAWVIPYGLLGLILLLVYARFLLRLPRHIAVLFVVSGSIFVAGAIGMEMVGASIAEATSRATLSYDLATTAEELLEMLGIALFIYALLRYASEQMGGLSISLGAAAHRQPLHTGPGRPTVS